MQAYSGETGQEHAPAGLVGEEPVGTRHGVLERLAPLGKVGLAGGLILFLFFCRTSQFVEGTWDLRPLAPQSKRVSCQL